VSIIFANTDDEYRLHLPMSAQTQVLADKEVKILPIHCFCCCRIAACKVNFETMGILHRI